MPALKEATDGALTTDAGRRFQAVATLLSKKLVLGFDLAGSRSIATRSTRALVLIQSGFGTNDVRTFYFERTKLFFLSQNELYLGKQSFESTFL